MLFSIELLKTFLAADENRSFTKAAERGHRTQSAVSMQMKPLEHEVGEPAFK
jgi:DNA-binding transcriptional LysR family regulator